MLKYFLLYKLMMQIHLKVDTSGNCNTVTLSIHYSVYLSIPISLTHCINQWCAFGGGAIWPMVEKGEVFGKTCLCDSFVNSQKRALKTQTTHFTHLIWAFSSKSPEPDTVSSPLTATLKGFVKITVATCGLLMMTDNSFWIWKKTLIALVLFYLRI